MLFGFVLNVAWLYFKGCFLWFYFIFRIERPNSPRYSSVESDIITEESFTCLHSSAHGHYVPTSHEKTLCLEHFLPLEVYCKSDETLICKTCATFEHRGHNKSYTIDAQVSYARLEIKTCTFSLNKLLQIVQLMHGQSWCGSVNRNIRISPTNISHNPEVKGNYL